MEKECTTSNNTNTTTDDDTKKSFTAEDLIELIRKSQPKRPPTDKAKLYIDKYPTINEAFSHARCEDRVTLQSIYNEGVDINFDVNTGNKLNMFNWAITAHSVCDPYFLEMMYKHGRKDIRQDGQTVFDLACAFGDARHINIFMKYRDEYPLDIFAGMRSAVLHRNRDNLHHLIIFLSPSSDQIAELWKVACGGFSSSVPMLLYMSEFLGCKVERETFIESLPRHFYDTLFVLMKLYLMHDKPFDIGSIVDDATWNIPYSIAPDSRTRESGFTCIVDKILSGTDDRLIKLQLLHDNGFVIKGYDDIMKADPSTLPKATSRRYYTNSM